MIKKENSMNKLKSNLIIKIIIFLSIILIIMIVVLKYLNNNGNKNIGIDVTINASEDYEEDEDYPYNAYKLFLEYKGTNKTKEITKSFSRFAKKVLPEYGKKLCDLSNDDIEKFFNNNSEDIIKTVGIDNIDDFKNLLKSIKELDYKNLKFDSFEIDSNNINKESDGVTGVLYILYENQEKIGFNVKLYNSKDQDSSLVLYKALIK